MKKIEKQAKAQPIAPALHQRFWLMMILSLITLISLVTDPLIAASRYLRVKVVLQGVDKVEAAFIASDLSIKIAEKELKLYQDRIESLHQIAPQEITHTLEALGFYHSHIQARLERTQSGFLASYQIQKGPPTRIQSISIHIEGEGQQHPALKKVLHHLPFITNAQLNHSVYEKFKQELLSIALQEGYLDAKFMESEIQIHRNQQSANIRIVLNTGPRYKFGTVTFKDPPYPIDYLKRYVPFSAGQPYTTAQLLACQKAFTETDLFKKVRLDPQTEQLKDTQIPLQIRLKARSKNKYTGSLGYGTDTGPRGLLGWEHRLRQYPGHRIHAEIRGSQVLRQVSLRYSLPGQNPTTDRIIFGFKGSDEHLRDKKHSRRGELSSTHIKRINQWERILGLHYLQEISRDIQIEPYKKSHFLLPTAGFIYRNFDPSTYPKDGFRIGLTFRGGLGVLWSSTDLTQSELRAKWVKCLGEKARFLFRTDIGATYARNFNKVPYSLRFFTGGDHTVRGYGYRTLGPQESDHQGKQTVVGGRYLAVMSMELERTVYKNAGLATFVDSGQAMNHWNTRLATSVGAGARYRTPLGALRLDIAKPLSLKKQPLRIHLTFGTDL